MTDIWRLETSLKRYDEFHYIDEFDNIHDIIDLNLVEPFEKFPGAVILNEHLGYWLQNIRSNQLACNWL